MKPAAWLAPALLLASTFLAGCDPFDAWLHPYDDAAPLQAVPPAPGKGRVDAYYGTNGTIILQARTSDCSREGCFFFVKGRWRPLAAHDATALPLLALNAATGSTYESGLWSPAGPGKFVLINVDAGLQNRQSGQFDGLRIGVNDNGAATYLTAFALEGNTLPEAKILVTEGRAWLLQVRPDRSSNLVELFAVKGPPSIRCLPGLAIETAQWAGPPETALSPNIFVSRAIDPAKAQAERKAVLAACQTAKPKS